nr:protein IWS1 homolog [Coffea arabica]
MVRIRGGSTGVGRSFRLRDEDIEIVEPSAKVSKKKTTNRGGKVKQTAQKNRDAPTVEPSNEQMEEHHSEEMEEPTHAEVIVSKSSGKRKRSAQKGSTDQSNAEKNAEVQHTPEPSTRKSPRTRLEVQSTELSAKQTAKRKRSGKKPVTQPAKEPFPLPKFINDESTFIEKRNLLVPPIPEFNESTHKKEPRPQPTEHTPGTKATPEAHASSSQPKDKGKAPVTVETTEDDDDDETEDEVDPEQFRLTRRRSGSLKITI